MKYFVHDKNLPYNPITAIESFFDTEVDIKEKVLLNSSLVAGGAEVTTTDVTAIPEGLSTTQLAQIDVLNRDSLGLEDIDFSSLRAITSSSEIVEFQFNGLIVREPFTSESLNNVSDNAHILPFKLRKTMTMEEIVEFQMVLSTLSHNFYIALAPLFSQFSEKGAFSATDALISENQARKHIRGYLSSHISENAQYAIECFFVHVLFSVRASSNNLSGAKVQKIIDLKNRKVVLDIAGLDKIFVVESVETLVEQTNSSIKEKISEILKGQKKLSESESRSLTSFSFVDDIAIILSTQSRLLAEQIRMLSHRYNMRMLVLKRALAWALVDSFKPTDLMMQQWPELERIKDCPNLYRLAHTVNIGIEILKDFKLEKCAAEFFSTAEALARTILSSKRILLLHKEDINELKIEKRYHKSKLALIEFRLIGKATAETPVVTVCKESYGHITKDAPKFKDLKFEYDQTVINLTREKPPINSSLAHVAGTNVKADSDVDVLPDTIVHGSAQVFNNYISTSSALPKYTKFLLNLNVLMSHPVVISRTISGQFRCYIKLPSVLPVLRGYQLPVGQILATDNATLAICLSSGTTERKPLEDININNRKIGEHELYKVFSTDTLNRMYKPSKFYKFTLDMPLSNNSTMQSWLALNEAETKIVLDSIRKVEFDRSDFQEEAWFSHARIFKDEAKSKMLVIAQKRRLQKFVNELTYREYINTLDDATIQLVKREQNITKLTSGVMAIMDVDIIRRRLNDSFEDAINFLPLAKTKLRDIFAPYLNSLALVNFTNSADFKFYSRILSVGLYEYFTFGKSNIGDFDYSSLNLLGYLGGSEEERLETMYAIVYEMVDRL